MTTGLELEGVTKRFGDNTIVEGIDLVAAEGEFLVLVGASGCGKSTILRMIAGLESVTAGRVLIKGRDVTYARPDERDIAMVFQNYALYPHMSVAENMSFALSLTRTPKAEIGRRVAEAARILGIEALLERKPKALSGGQRQRVAMGRAIVREPAVFLFDEPLSNLDAKLRAQMRVELALLHRRLGKTTVYVTHDQVEAMTLADRIVILERGVIQQIGTPGDVFNHPRNTFVAGFIGSPVMNLFAARAVDPAAVVLAASGARIALPRPVPASGAATTNYLYGMWTSSPTNGWAVGDSGTLLNYTGASYTNSAQSGVISTTGLRAVWGTSSFNIYAVGYSGTILNYNFSSWQKLTSNTVYDLYGIWGTATNNIWAVGGNGTLLRYNGTAWTPDAATSTLSTSTYLGVWAANASNVWAVGTGGTIANYNGTQWSLSVSGVRTNLWGVWGTSLADVWAVGDSASILRYQP
jgi:ABC-type sugar transport system ATPase subunit